MRTAGITVLIIWVLSAGFALFLHFVPKLFGYYTSNMLMALVLPTTIFIAVSYGCIYYKVRQHRRRVVHFTDQPESNRPADQDSIEHRSQTERNLGSVTRDSGTSVLELGSSQHYQPWVTRDSNIITSNFTGIPRHSGHATSQNSLLSSRTKNRRRFNRVDPSERKVLYIGMAIVELFIICHFPATFLFLILTEPTPKTLKYFIVAFTLVSLNSVGNSVIYLVYQYNKYICCHSQGARAMIPISENPRGKHK